MLLLLSYLLLLLLPLLCLAATWPKVQVEVQSAEKLSLSRSLRVSRRLIRRHSLSLSRSRSLSFRLKRKRWLCILSPSCSVSDCPHAVSFACIDFEFRCCFYFRYFFLVGCCCKFTVWPNVFCSVAYLSQFPLLYPLPFALADRRRTHASLIYGACAFIGPLPNASDSHSSGKGTGNVWPLWEILKKISLFI